MNSQEIEDITAEIYSKTEDGKTIFKEFIDQVIEFDNPKNITTPASIKNGHNYTLNNCVFYEGNPCIASVDKSGVLGPIKFLADHLGYGTIQETIKYIIIKLNLDIETWNSWMISRILDNTNNGGTIIKWIRTNDLSNIKDINIDSQIVYEHDHDREFRENGTGKRKWTINWKNEKTKERKETDIIEFLIARWQVDKKTLFHLLILHMRLDI